MISVRIKAPLLRYQRCYFAAQPRSGAANGLVEFTCCPSQQEQRWFRRSTEYTKLIDLQPSGSALLDTLPKQCRYKIQRAEREGVACGTSEDFQEYFAFHAEFCRSKHRPAPSWEFFAAHREHLMITKAMHGPDTLAMHAHLVDPGASRGRLFTSSSLFRDEKDNSVRAMIGRANRYLHFWDMREMAARGLRVYDFGGYAPHTTDPALVGLNEFKDSFGGTVAGESTFVSLPLDLSRRTIALARRVTHPKAASAGTPDTRPQTGSDSGD